jgi:RimJ/RimL family protein N-acetyltransferase
MRAAVFGRESGRFERVLHGTQIAAGDGYVIDMKFFSYHRKNGEQSRENVFRHVDPILTIPLETERLILDKWQGPDWTELRPIATDVEVMRYITGGVPWTDEQIQAFVNRQVKLYSERNFCRWKVLRKPERETIGFCGVGYWRDAPDPEIGWWIARKSWGQGLATEAARTALQHAFDHAGFDRIISVAQPPNTASIRIMEKIGLARDCEFESEGVRLVRYVTDRATWRATNGSLLP